MASARDPKPPSSDLETTTTTSYFELLVHTRTGLVAAPSLVAVAVAVAAPAPTHRSLFDVFRRPRFPSARLPACMQRAAAAPFSASAAERRDWEGGDRDSILPRYTSPAPTRPPDYSSFASPLHDDSLHDGSHTPSITTTTTPTAVRNAARTKFHLRPALLIVTLLLAIAVPLGLSVVLRSG
ncbi:hypothetical protein LTR36_010328 [Oleoguttula mirabilis]|uniref:Uncharacterized protein n=1 Tax=Oleoguttula mirabilis TaxID=1507867 RepID=A0AAV9J587_9PEZI|nr:hypothetical protein LTR36_010328 [Oleoguttula mirabilis]